MIITGGSGFIGSHLVEALALAESVKQEALPFRGE
jgi:nucleoside-diphosphate-sugar epimerase